MGFDRPSGPPKQSRSVVLGRYGMVATSQPLAAQVGLDVLQAGGNAVDAAIAVNAMLGVVEPMSCGVGGDLFAIYWDAASQQLYGLNASGRSPFQLSREDFRERKLKQIPVDGPLSWSVPGCVSGWDALNRRFGTRSLAENLVPAIVTAHSGFPVTELIANTWAGSAKDLAKWPGSAAIYLPGGKPPKMGQLFRNIPLAHTYRRIAHHGASDFYQGEIAEELVRFSEANGGHFSLRDFVDHDIAWVEPVSTNYRGHQVWELPPNGQGIAALQILNVLQQHDVKKMGPGSADFVHLFTEAKKLAFADRAKFYSDPAFNDLPVDELISKAYARRQAKRIDMRKAASDVRAGDPQLARGDTVYITVVDKHRNCCSLIQSNYYGFGSKVTPERLGFALQNRGALFSLQDDHFNRLESHKRPFHTIIPAMVTKDGKPLFCFGVMGGDMQPQGHVQVLVNLIDFGMNVQAAGDAPRVRHRGSATPRGEPADGVGELLIESGIGEEVEQELKKRGHKVVRTRGAFGGYQGILIDWKNGVLHGASEVRKDGAAVGY